MYIWVQKLKNKMVAFGRVDQGVFRKGDTVRIDHGTLPSSGVLFAIQGDLYPASIVGILCLRVTSSYALSHAALPCILPVVTSNPNTNLPLSQAVCAPYANRPEALLRGGAILA